MNLIPVLFLALNIAFPVWLFTRLSRGKPTTQWELIREHTSRLALSDGGFEPCSSLDVVDHIESLCEMSRQRYLADPEVKRIELPAGQVDLFCEYRPDSYLIGWQRSAHTEGTMECGAHGTLLDQAPAFSFNFQGRIRSLWFTSQNGQREQIPYHNCKVKAVDMKGWQSAPPTLDEFIKQIKATPGDPEDALSGNKMCFVFDSSGAWESWRKFYKLVP